MRTENLSISYEDKMAVHNVSMDVYDKSLTAIIGASGSGKSSFLSAFNRMTDVFEGCSISGKIYLDEMDIHDPQVDVVFLRTLVGMVFQKPVPFPKSIYDNVAYGPRLHFNLSKSELDEIVYDSLMKVSLWSEVKDRLGASGISLSGGQQQRLCIARAIAIRPQVLLMDEPCSALDPIATAKVENLLISLSQEFAILVVTHSMQQARRISQNVAFFHMGHLEEFGSTEQIFNDPQQGRTRDYIEGKFG